MIRRGFAGSCLCLGGGALTATLPRSSWWAQLAPVAAVRDSAAGRGFGIVLVVTGVALVATAWLSLLRRNRHATADDLRSRLTQVRWATAAWSLPLLLAPPLFSRDGWSYAAQGEMTHMGLSPYIWGPSVLQGPIVEAVDPRWLNTPAPYGPLPLVWGSLGAAFTDDPWLLVIAMRLFALGGMVLLAYALPRLSLWSGKDPAYVSGLVLASPLMLAHGVAGLHNDVMMAGLMALALVVAVERNWVLGAVLAGMAAAVKLPGGLVGIGVALVSLAGVVTWQARLRRMAAVAAVAAATLAGAGAVAGVGSGWVSALSVPGQVRTPLSVSTQAGALVERLLTAEGWPMLAAGSVATLRALAALAALAIITWVAVRAPTGVPASAVRTTAFALLVTVALSPVVQYWYALWFLPLLATCALSRRVDTVLVGGSLVVGLAASLDGVLAGGYLGVGFVVTLVLATTTALITYERHDTSLRERRDVSRARTRATLDATCDAGQITRP